MSLSLHPRNDLCVVECSLRGGLALAGQEKGPVFCALGHECGVGAQISLACIVFSFHSLLCFFQAKKLTTITFADENSEHS